MAPPQAATQGRQSILPLFPLLSSHQLATRLDASVQLLSSLPLAAATASDPDTPYALKRLIAGLASSNESARQGFAVALSQLVALLPDERAKHVLPQLIEQTTSKAGMDSREERDLLFARLMGLHALVRSGVLTRASLNDAGEAWQEVVQALVSLANKKTWIREPSYWVVCEALRALLESEAEWKDECVKWAVQRLVNDAREKAKGWGPEKVAIVLVLQSYGVSADWSSVLSPSFPSGSLLSRSSLSTLASALKGSASSSSSSDPSSSAPKQGVNATKTSKGAAAPAPGQAPHFVWTLLRDVYFPAKEKAATVEDKVKFADFWRVCVDQSLFASPSLPLKSLGFSLITLFLPSLPSSELLSLLNLPNTLRVFANHLRSSAGAGGAEKTLSRVADKLASSALPAYLAQEPSAALPLLKALTGAPHSSYNAFEPKVLERFVARLPLSGVKGWISHLQTMILSPSAATDEDFTLSGAVIEGEEDLLPAEREKRVTAQRTWALDQLLHVGKNGGVAKDEEALKGLLEFLAVVGWFEVKKEGSKGARSYIPSPAFTSAHRLAARTRFFSILTALVSLPSTPAASSSSTPSTPTVAGGPAWLARALALLDALKADEKHFSSADAEDEDDEDDEAKEVEEKVKGLYAKLAPSSAAAPAAAEGKKGKKGRKSASSSSDAAPAVDAKDTERRAVARSLIEGVRLVSWDEGAEDAADVLESTVDAVSALFPALFPSVAGEDASMNEDDDDEEEEAPEPTTILMDLLLALLRRPSAFVKQVAGVVLKGFADEVGSQAVELVVEQWRVDEEEEGEKEDEEMKDGEEKEPKKGKKVEGADDEDEEDEDEEDDSDDEGFEVDEAFKNELLAALEAGGMAVPNGAIGSDDEESADEDESPVAKGDDDDEEILDDDAMLELDERLADIFRANGGGRRSKKRDRTDSLHYRLRCLDLLDVLAHHNPSFPFLIPTFVPLFNLVRTATSVEHELQTKASKLLRFVVQPRKTASATSSSSSTAPQPSEETAASALEALDELYRITASVDAADLAPLAAQVSLALIKAAVSSAPSTAPAEISRLAGASFASYVNTKNAKTKCQPALMSEAAKRAPAAVWGARDEVLELAKGEKVNAFRKVQAFEVVQTLVTSYAALKTPESKSALLAFLPSYRSALYSVISSSFSSSSTTGSLDAPRLKLLAKHALSAARLTVQLSCQSEAASLWQPQEWAALLDPAQGKVSDRFKGATGVLSLIRQLVGVLGQSVESKPAAAGGKKEKKRKAADSVDAAAPATAATPSKAAAAGTATPKSSKKAKTAAASTPSASTPAAAAPASAAKPKPEEEVQDESIEDEAVDGDAGQGTPSGKKGKKKDKKRRRSEGGKA